MRLPNWIAPMLCAGICWGCGAIQFNGPSAYHRFAYQDVVSLTIFPDGSSTATASSGDGVAQRKVTLACPEAPRANTHLFRVIRGVDHLDVFVDCHPTPERAVAAAAEAHCAGPTTFTVTGDALNLDCRRAETAAAGPIRFAGGRFGEYRVAARSSDGTADYSVEWQSYGGVGHLGLGAAD